MNTCFFWVVAVYYVSRGLIYCSYLKDNRYPRTIPNATPPDDAFPLLFYMAMAALSLILLFRA